ncbi:hypothetical protein SCFA_740020 [anaerobic digester metagenome]|uniref:Uncharacterized protein n=1 Tax=anaerobic digester metagenome TaxID=1263854 RepID=A0A485M4I8_9ZZZZ
MLPVLRDRPCTAHYLSAGSPPESIGFCIRACNYRWITAKIPAVSCRPLCVADASFGHKNMNYGNLSYHNETSSAILRCRYVAAMTAPCPVKSEVRRFSMSTTTGP